jgi:hypothetical protein
MGAVSSSAVATGQPATGVGISVDGEARSTSRMVRGLPHAFTGKAAAELFGELCLGKTADGASLPHSLRF